MAQWLKGSPVAAALCKNLAVQVAELGRVGVAPALAMVRIGNRPDDLAYQRSAAQRCAAAGVRFGVTALPAGVSQGELVQTLRRLNGDTAVHGVLLLRPLPNEMDDAWVRNSLAPEKDVDGITDASLGGVFSGSQTGFAPCTAGACMEILNYYDVSLEGKRVAVVGRSLVVGRPAAVMLTARNATVTLCHTRTGGLADICREADILVAAAGRSGLIGRDCLAPGQVVVDVGITVDEEGNMRGDVDAAAAEEIVAAYTPVPGGVGVVTSSVLVGNVVRSACRAVK